MAEGQDARVQEVFGPKFYFETGNPANSDYGPEASSIKSTNDDGRRFVIAHHENNTTRVETEGELLLQAASKSSKFQTGINVISHGGDIQVNSTNRSVGIKANDELILEANSIILKANKIQIGDAFAHGTKEITLNATRIEVQGKAGSLPTHLKTSWAAAIASGPGSFVDFGKFLGQSGI